VLNSLNCGNQPESKSVSIRERLEKVDLPQSDIFKVNWAIEMLEY